MAESNFWTERRAARSASSLAQAPAPSGLKVEDSPIEGLTRQQYQLLAQLPGATPFGLGVSENVSVAPALPAPASPLPAPAAPGAAARNDSPTWLSSLILPFGSVRDVHISPRVGAPLVIHIQDAHQVEEAQKNMAAMIQGLLETRGVDLVGLEGAQGAFAVQAFRDYAEPGAARGIAEHFLREGYIGAPEYVALTAPRPPLLWGAEDEALYEANVAAFTGSVGLKAGLASALGAYGEALDELKAREYSPALKEFDRRFAAYRDMKEGLGDYVRYLTARAGEAAAPFTNLHVLLDALAWEEGLDFDKVEQERVELVKVMAERLSEAQLNGLVQQSLLYRLGRLGYGDYHRFLRRLCRESGIDLASFGQLGSYINYVLLAEQINRNELLGEIADLEDAVERRLVATPAQARLAALNRNLLLLRKLADHSMTPADWLYYAERRADVQRVGAELAALGRPARGVPSGEALAETLKPFEDFCVKALARNSHLVSNLLDKMKSQNAAAAVLVAGGFHSDGLAQLLRARDVSYVVVTPKIGEVPKEGHYLDVFAHDPLPLEKLFAGEAIYLAPRSVFAESAGDLRARIAQGLAAALAPALKRLQAIRSRASGEDLEALQRGLSEAAARLADALRELESFSFEPSADSRPGLYEAIDVSLSWRDAPETRFRLLLAPAQSRSAVDALSAGDFPAESRVAEGALRVDGEEFLFRLHAEEGWRAAAAAFWERVRGPLAGLIEEEAPAPGPTAVPPAAKALERLRPELEAAGFSKATIDRVFAALPLKSLDWTAAFGFESRSGDRTRLEEQRELVKRDLRRLIRAREAAGEREFVFVGAGLGQLPKEAIALVETFDEALREEAAEGFVADPSLWAVRFVGVDGNPRSLSQARAYFKVINADFRKFIPFRDLAVGEVSMEAYEANFTDEEALRGVAEGPAAADLAVRRRAKGRPAPDGPLRADYITHRHVAYVNKQAQYHKSPLTRPLDRLNDEQLLRLLNVFTQTRGLIAAFAGPGTRYVSEPGSGLPLRQEFGGHRVPVFSLPGAKLLTAGELAPDWYLPAGSLGDRATGILEVFDPEEAAGMSLAQLRAHVAASASGRGEDILAAVAGYYGDGRGLDALKRPDRRRLAERTAALKSSPEIVAELARLGEDARFGELILMTFLGLKPLGVIESYSTLGSQERFAVVDALSRLDPSFRRAEVDGDLVFYREDPLAFFDVRRGGYGDFALHGGVSMTGAEVDAFFHKGRSPLALYRAVQALPFDGTGRRTFLYGLLLGYGEEAARGYAQEDDGLQGLVEAEWTVKDFFGADLGGLVADRLDPSGVRGLARLLSFARRLSRAATLPDMVAEGFGIGDGPDAHRRAVGEALLFSLSQLDAELLKQSLLHATENGPATFAAAMTMRDVLTEDESINQALLSVLFAKFGVPNAAREAAFWSRHGRNAAAGVIDLLRQRHERALVSLGPDRAVPLVELIRARPLPGGAPSLYGAASWLPMLRAATLRDRAGRKLMRAVLVAAGKTARRLGGSSGHKVWRGVAALQRGFSVREGQGLSVDAVIAGLADLPPASVLPLELIGKVLRAASFSFLPSESPLFREAAGVLAAFREETGLPLSVNEMHLIRGPPLDGFDESRFVTFAEGPGGSVHVYIHEAALRDWKARDESVPGYFRNTLALALAHEVLEFRLGGHDAAVAAGLGIEEFDAFHRDRPAEELWRLLADRTKAALARTETAPAPRPARARREEGAPAKGLPAGEILEAIEGARRDHSSHPLFAAIEARAAAWAAQAARVGRAGWNRAVLENVVRPVLGDGPEDASYLARLEKAVSEAEEIPSWWSSADPDLEALPIFSPAPVGAASAAPLFITLPKFLVKKYKLIHPVSAVWIADKSGKVVLLRRPNPGAVWMLMAGKARGAGPSAFERPEEAAAREFREELSFKPRPERFVRYDSFVSGAGELIQLLVYPAGVDAGRIALDRVDRREIGAMRWVDLGSLRREAGDHPEKFGQVARHILEDGGRTETAIGRALGAGKFARTEPSADLSGPESALLGLERRGVFDGVAEKDRPKAREALRKFLHDLYSRGFTLDDMGPYRLARVAWREDASGTFRVARGTRAARIKAEGLLFLTVGDRGFGLTHMRRRPWTLGTLGLSRAEGLERHLGRPVEDLVVEVLQKGQVSPDRDGHTMVYRAEFNGLPLEVYVRDRTVITMYPKEDAYLDGLGLSVNRLQDLAAQLTGGRGVLSRKSLRAAYDRGRRELHLWDKSSGERFSFVMRPGGAERIDPPSGEADAFLRPGMIDLTTMVWYANGQPRRGAHRAAALPGLAAAGLRLAAFLGLPVRASLRRPGLRVAFLQNYPQSMTGKMTQDHLRRRGVEVVTFDAFNGNLPNLEHFDAVIGSGSGYNVREERDKSWVERQKNLYRAADVPVLGICFSHHLIAEAFGGGSQKAWGYRFFLGINDVDVDGASPLFRGLPGRIPVAEAHGDEVHHVPDDFTEIARSEMALEALQHRDRPIFTVQFHPEWGDFVRRNGASPEYGEKILDNFIGIARRHKAQRLRDAYATKVAWWLEELVFGVLPAALAVVPGFQLAGLVAALAATRLLFIALHYEGRGPPLWGSFAAPSIVSALPFVAFLPAGFIGVPLAALLYAALGLAVHFVVNRGVFRKWKGFPSAYATIGATADGLTRRGVVAGGLAALFLSVFRVPEAKADSIAAWVRAALRRGSDEALEALRGRLEDPAVLAELVAALRETRRGSVERRVAAIVLGRLPQPAVPYEAVAALVDALDSPDDFTARNAVSALQSLGAQRKLAEEGGKRFSMTEAVIAAGDAGNKREHALRALMRFDVPRARALMDEYFPNRFSMAKTALDLLEARESSAPDAPFVIPSADSPEVARAAEAARRLLRSDWAADLGEFKRAAMRPEGFLHFIEVLSAVVVLHYAEGRLDRARFSTALRKAVQKPWLRREYKGMNADYEIGGEYIEDADSREQLLFSFAHEFGHNLLQAMGSGEAIADSHGAFAELFSDMAGLALLESLGLPTVGVVEGLFEGTYCTDCSGSARPEAGEWVRERHNAARGFLRLVDEAARELDVRVDYGRFFAAMRERVSVYALSLGTPEENQARRMLLSDVLLDYFAAASGRRDREALRQEIARIAERDNIRGVARGIVREGASPFYVPPESVVTKIFRNYAPAGGGVIPRLVDAGLRIGGWAGIRLEAPRSDAAAFRAEYGARIGWWFEEAVFGLVPASLSFIPGVGPALLMVAWIAARLFFLALHADAPGGRARFLAPALISLASAASLALTAFGSPSLEAAALLSAFIGGLVHFGVNRFVASWRAPRAPVESPNPPAAEVRRSRTAVSYADAAQEFEGVDLEHFVHAQNRLAARSLGAERLSALARLLGVSLSGGAAEDYARLYAALADRGYSKAVVDAINGDSYADPRLSVEIVGQNVNPKAQGLYEAVANSLDALGLEIGQFGKGVKQIVDWLEPTGRDRVDVYTRHDGEARRLTLLKDSQGQIYVQIGRVDDEAFFAEAGEAVHTGTVLRVTTDRPLALEPDEADGYRPTVDELVGGVHRRFPFVASVDVTTQRSDEDPVLVNGFKRKRIVVPFAKTPAFLAGRRGRVSVGFAENSFLVVDTGSGMSGVTLARMFVPKQGSKHPEPLGGAAAEEELKRTGIVHDPTLPHRVSFSRNGEVVAAFDVPADVEPSATVPGGLMIELGRLADVPESRDGIVIPLDLRPGEASNFQKGIESLVARLAAVDGLSAAEKLAFANTLAVGLDALVQGNENYAHVIGQIRVAMRKSLAGAVARAAQEGFTLLPHEGGFGRLALPAGRRPLFLHPALFDWRGVESLRALGAVAVPNWLTLGGRKRLSLVFAPFTPEATERVRAFHKEWHEWSAKDRLPLIKTADFVALPLEMGERVAALTARRRTSPEETAELAALLQLVNIVTAEEVPTSYELAPPAANLVLTAPSVPRSSGEIDSEAVNAFLVVPPGAAALPKSGTPADAFPFALLSNGDLVDARDGSVRERHVKSVRPLGNGHLLLVTAVPGWQEEYHLVRWSPDAAGAAWSVKSSGFASNWKTEVSPDGAYVATINDTTKRLDSLYSTQKGDTLGLQDVAGRAEHFRFTPDGRYATFFYQDDGGRAYFGALDLATKKMTLQPLPPGVTLGLVKGYVVPPNAPVALVSFHPSGRQKFYVMFDLDGRAEPEVASLVRTDSSGTYTVFERTDGVRVIYLHESRKFLSASDFGGPWDWVITAWRNETPAYFLVHVGKREFLFDAAGSVRPVAAGDNLALDSFESFAMDGTVSFGGDAANQSVGVGFGQQEDEATVFRDESGLFVLDAPGGAGKRVYDPATGKGAHVGRLHEVADFDETDGSMTLRSPDMLTKVRLDGQGGTIVSTLEEPALSPGGWSVVRRPDGYSLRRTGLGAFKWERRLIVPLSYSEVSFDGKYFVFTDPFLGENAYVNPLSPDEFLAESAAAGLQALPADAAKASVIARDAAGAPMIRDLKSGRDLAGTPGQIDQIDRVGEDLFVVRNDFGGWNLIRLTHDQNVVEVVAAGNLLDSDVVNHSPLAAIVAAPSGEFYALDLANGKRNVVPAAGAVLSATGRFSLLTYPLQGNVAYVDHESDDLEPRLAFVDGEIEEYVASDKADVVIARRPDGRYLVFNLAIPARYPHAFEHVEVNSSGGFLVARNERGTLDVVNLKTNRAITGPFDTVRIAVEGARVHVLARTNDGRSTVRFTFDAATGEPVDLTPEEESPDALPRYWEQFSLARKTIWDRRTGASVPGFEILYAENPPIETSEYLLLDGPNVFHRTGDESRLLDLRDGASWKGRLTREEQAFRLLDGGAAAYTTREDGTIHRFLWKSGGQYEQSGIGVMRANETNTHVIREYGVTVLQDGEGRSADITGDIPIGYQITESDGPYFVLYSASEQKTLYLDPRVLMARYAGEEREDAAARERALKLWMDGVFARRDAMIAAARAGYNGLLEALPEDARAPAEATIGPRIAALFRGQVRGVYARYGQALSRGASSVDLDGLPFEAAGGRLAAAAARLAEAMPTLRERLETESAEFRRTFHANLAGALFDLASGELDLPAMDADFFVTLGLGYEFRSRRDLDRLDALIAFWKGFVQELQPPASLEDASAVMSFVSRVSAESPEAQAVLFRQIGKILALKTPAARRKVLGGMVASFKETPQPLLRAGAVDPSQQTALGAARPYAVFLTHDVQLVKSKARPSEPGRDARLPKGGVLLSRILNLEEDRPKSGEGDAVMDLDYLLARLDDLPAPTEALEAEILKNTEVQRESGAYAAEITQNTLDAVKGGKGELEVEFFTQRGESGEEEFVEEARDNGTGALREVALLIPRSTKAAGRQEDLIGFFGTGKYTVFEGADRVEILSRNGERSVLFRFDVERDSTGKALAVKLSGIRALAPGGPTGVTVRRIKKASSTIPELDQMLAERSWKTFAGLAAGAALQIVFVGSGDERRPLAVRRETLSETDFVSGGRSYGPFRVLAVEDAPSQVVDRAGLRVGRVKDEYLALVPESIRKKMKELGLVLQIPLPLIRNRSGFEHENERLADIQKYAAAEIFRAVAYKTLTQTAPQFVFEGFPVDWETNDAYWSAIDFQDEALIGLARKISGGRVADVRPSELEAVLADSGRLDKDKAFVKLILLLEVAPGLIAADKPQSLAAQRLAVQRRVNEARARLQQKMLGIKDEKIAGARVDHVEEKVRQAAAIEEGHEQMRHPERYRVEPRTDAERRLVEHALGIARHFGLTEVVLMEEGVRFAGAFRGGTMYLSRSLAGKLGQEGANGSDEATDTIVHELAHFLEKLMKENRRSLGSNEVYVSHSTSFSHDAVGAFAEAMKYVAAVALAAEPAKRLALAGAVIRRLMPRRGGLWRAAAASLGRLSTGEPLVSAREDEAAVRRYGATTAWWLEEAIFAGVPLAASLLPFMSPGLAVLALALARAAFVALHLPAGRAPPRWTPRAVFDVFAAPTLVALAPFLAFTADVPFHAALLAYGAAGLLVHLLVNLYVFLRLPGAPLPAAVRAGGLFSSDESAARIFPAGLHFALNEIDLKAGLGALPLGDAPASRDALDARLRRLLALPAAKRAEALRRYRELFDLNARRMKKFADPALLESFARLEKRERFTSFPPEETLAANYLEVFRPRELEAETKALVETLRGKMESLNSADLIAALDASAGRLIDGLAHAEDRDPLVQELRLRFYRAVLAAGALPERFVKLGLTTSRDGQQSNVGTSFKGADQRRVIELQAALGGGIHDLETWGGAAIQSLLLESIHKDRPEDPFTQLRKITQVLRKNLYDVLPRELSDADRALLLDRYRVATDRKILSDTELAAVLDRYALPPAVRQTIEDRYRLNQEMLLRGQYIVGLDAYPDSILKLFIETSFKNGMDVFRIFDALNDSRNIVKAVQFVREVGGRVQPVIHYTTGFPTGTAGYVALAKELIAASGDALDALTIKDAGGLLEPEAAYELVKALRDAGVTAPIHVHTHDTRGNRLLTLLEAIRANGEEHLIVVDVAAGKENLSSPFAQPDLGDFLRMVDGTSWARELRLDPARLAALEEAIAGELMPKYLNRLKASTKDRINAVLARLPGGMKTNFLDRQIVDVFSDQLKNGHMRKGYGSLLVEPKFGVRMFDADNKFTPEGQLFVDALLELIYQEMRDVTADAGGISLVTPTSQWIGVQAFNNVMNWVVNGYLDVQRADGRMRLVKNDSFPAERVGAYFTSTKQFGLAGTLRNYIVSWSQDAHLQKLYPGVNRAVVMKALETLGDPDLDLALIREALPLDSSKPIDAGKIRRAFAHYDGIRAAINKPFADMTVVRIRALFRQSTDEAVKAAFAAGAFERALVRKVAGGDPTLNVPLTFEELQTKFDASKGSYPAINDTDEDLLLLALFPTQAPHLFKMRETWAAVLQGIKEPWKALDVLPAMGFRLNGRKFSGAVIKELAPFGRRVARLIGGASAFGDRPRVRVRPADELITTSARGAKRDPALARAMRARIQVVAQHPDVRASGEAELDAMFEEAASRPLTRFERDLFAYFTSGPAKDVPVEFHPATLSRDGGFAAWDSSNPRGEPHVWFSRPPIYSGRIEEPRTAFEMLKHELSHVMDAWREDAGGKDLAAYKGFSEHHLAFRELRANLWAFDGDVERAVQITRFAYNAVSNTLDSVVPAGYSALNQFLAVEALAAGVPEQLYTGFPRDRRRVAAYVRAVDPRFEPPLIEEDAEFELRRYGATTAWWVEETLFTVVPAMTAFIPGVPPALVVALLAVLRAAFVVLHADPDAPRGEAWKTLLAPLTVSIVPFTAFIGLAVVPLTAAINLYVFAAYGTHLLVNLGVYRGWSSAPGWLRGYLPERPAALRRRKPSEPAKRIETLAKALSEATLEPVKSESLSVDAVSGRESAVEEAVAGLLKGRRAVAWTHRLALEEVSLERGDAAGRKAAYLKLTKLFGAGERRPVEADDEFWRKLYYLDREALAAELQTRPASETARRLEARLAMKVEAALGGAAGDAKALMADLFAELDLLHAAGGSLFGGESGLPESDRPLPAAERALHERRDLEWLLQAAAFLGLTAGGTSELRRAAAAGLEEAANLRGVRARTQGVTSSALALSDAVLRGDGPILFQVPPQAFAAAGLDASALTQVRAIATLARWLENDESLLRGRRVIFQVEGRAISSEAVLDALSRAAEADLSALRPAAAVVGSDEIDGYRLPSGEISGRAVRDHLVSRGFLGARQKLDVFALLGSAWNRDGVEDLVNLIVSLAGDLVRDLSIDVEKGLEAARLIRIQA